MIFESPDNRYPSVEELVLCDLFRNIDLREMRGPSISVSLNLCSFCAYTCALCMLCCVFMCGVRVYICFALKFDEISLIICPLWLCSHLSMVWVFLHWICWMRFDEDRELHWMAHTVKAVHHAHHPQHHAESGKFFTLLVVGVITPKKSWMKTETVLLLIISSFSWNVSVSNFVLTNFFICLLFCMHSLIQIETTTTTICLFVFVDYSNYAAAPYDNFDFRFEKPMN